MAVTLRDIAREAGVSVTTASRALAGYTDVAAGTRQRVRHVAAQLGYVPNETARRLQKQRTDTLGFIIPTCGSRFSDPFFSEFIAGIGNEAADHGYDLLVSTHAPHSEREREAYERAVRGGWVDGLVVVRTRVDDPRIRLLCRHDFPFVAFGRSNVLGDYSFVDVDSTAGFRLLVQHFIDLGHRRIAFIAAPAGLMCSRYRQQGYQETMQANGLPVQAEWMVEGDLTQRGGAQAMERLLELPEPPTALVAGNDLMAIGAISRMQQRGLQAGRDIAVGGFDDIPLAAFTNPPLTTVQQPIYEIGRQVCAQLIALITGRAAPLQRVLTPVLVVRESSGVKKNADDADEPD